VTSSPFHARGRLDGGLVMRVIRWINEQAPLGGGATGLADEAFAAMVAGDCRGVVRMIEAAPGEVGEPVRSVYVGAASACLAAFEGRPELWPRAEAAAARVAGRASQLACEERAVHRLLGRLLQAHRADPDARLTRGPVGVRGVLACPRFTGITPGHGPAEGGYPVRISGEHLPRTVGVNFGPDHHVEAVAEDGELTVTVPRPRLPVPPTGRWPSGPTARSAGSPARPWSSPTTLPRRPARRPCRPRPRPSRPTRPPARPRHLLPRADRGRPGPGRLGVHRLHGRDRRPGRRVAGGGRGRRHAAADRHRRLADRHRPPGCCSTSAGSGRASRCGNSATTRPSWTGRSRTTSCGASTSCSSP
jgi:hypothetical protein